MPVCVGVHEEKKLQPLYFTFTSNVSAVIAQGARGEDDSVDRNTGSARVRTWVQISRAHIKARCLA